MATHSSTSPSTTNPTTRTTGKAGPTTTTRSLVARVLVAASLIFTAAVAMTAAPAAASTSVRVTSAGDLIITGTNGPEDVVLQRIGSSTLVVDVFWAGGSASHEVPTVIRNLVVNLKGGDDSFQMPLKISNTRVGRDMKVNLGSGSNALFMDAVVVERNLRVIDGAGPVSIVYRSNTVRGSATHTLGAGASTVRSDFNAFDRSYKMTTASTGSLDLRTSDDIHRGTYRVSGGNGIDTLDYTYGGQFRGTTTIDTKGGDDRLFIRDDTKFTGRLNLRLGSGADRANIDNAEFNTGYTMNAGSGDDEILLDGNRFHASGKFDGGGGYDVIDGNNDFFVAPTVVRFEYSVQP